MRRECDWAGDVAAAIAGGGLPSEGDNELGRHVAACESCREMVQVMWALRGEREAARRAALVPSSGLVWWRAQLRRRQEAARRAAAPVTVVHAVSLVAVLVFAACLAWTIAGQVSLRDIAPGLPSLAGWIGAAHALSASPALRVGLILGASAWLILGPVALYLALHKDP
jgi:predicted anti-sigma-YlaC factor YlaD